MATNINEINRRFRQTVSDINQGQAKSTVNFSMIENLANKADNVLLKSVESSVKNVNRNPNLATVDAEIKKLATIKDSTIFQETDNYINTSIEDLKVTRNYIQNRNTTLDNIRNSVKSFSAKDRDDVAAYTNITDMIFKAELDGYLNTDQRKIELASLNQRRSMLDDEADAVLLNDALIKIASATTPKQVASIAGEYMVKAKDDTGFQRLMSFSDKLNRAANSANTESMKNVARNASDRMVQFLNNLDPMYKAMVLADQNYETKPGTNNDLQLIIKNQPAFDDYGSKAPANVHNWNVDGFANDIAKDLVKMADIENFTDKDSKNIKAYVAEHKNALENIFDPDHRMHMKTYVNMLSASQSPDNNADTTELNSITSRYEILKQIYNMGPQAYPDKFLVDGEPIFGDGNPRTQRSFSMDLYSTSAESTNVSQQEVVSDSSDRAMLPVDFESSNLSDFLKLDARFKDNIIANETPPSRPDNSLPGPQINIADDVSVDMTGSDFNTFEDMPPFNEPPFIEYEDHLPLELSGKTYRYFSGSLANDLDEIRTIRDVVKEHQNRGDIRNAQRAATRLASVEQRVRNMIGKSIHPDSGRILFNESQSYQKARSNYNEGFEPGELEQLLKSLSTVEKK